MKKYFLISLFVGVTCNLYCQDYLNVFKEMRDHNVETDSFCINMKIRSYRQWNDTLPFSSQTILISRKNNTFRYDYEKYVVIITKNEQVLVNKELKNIVISKRKKEKHLSIMPIDSINSKYDSIVSEVDNNGSYHIRMFCRSRMDVQSDLYVSEDFKLQRIEIYYNTTSDITNKKLIIDYLKWDSTPVLSNQLFDIKSIVIKSGDKFIPVEQYKQYQVFNYL